MLYVSEERRQAQFCEGGRDTLMGRFISRASSIRYGVDEFVYQLLTSIPASFHDSMTPTFSMRSGTLGIHKVFIQCGVDYGAEMVVGLFNLISDWIGLRRHPPFRVGSYHRS
jgi:hypothetical protein